MGGLRRRGLSGSSVVVDGGESWDAVSISAFDEGNFLRLAERGAKEVSMRDFVADGGKRVPIVDHSREPYGLQDFAQALAAEFLNQGTSAASSFVRIEQGDSGFLGLDVFWQKQSHDCLVLELFERGGKEHDGYLSFVVVGKVLLSHKVQHRGYSKFGPVKERLV